MLHDFIQIFIISTLIFGLGYYLQVNRKGRKWIERLKQTESIFLLLIGWVILGFFTTLDYNQQWGDVIRSEPIFSIQNICYSSITLVLLFIGYLISNPKVSIVFLILELLFWGFKLFFIKGGYEVGFAGGAATSVLWYDLIALVLRLLLIKRTIPLSFNSIYVFIFALVIMIIKVSFF